MSLVGSMNGWEESGSERAMPYPWERSAAAA
jgi:hypothetical protein